MSDQPNHASGPARPSDRQVRLAVDALRHALADEWPEAIEAIGTLDDEPYTDPEGHQVDGIYVALCVWSDYYAAYASDGLHDPERFGPAMGLIKSSTGEFHRAGEGDAPPAVEWAAQIIHARCAMDHDRLTALMVALPDSDELEIGAHVLAVLECVVATVNALPRGFAVMHHAAARGAVADMQAADAALAIVAAAGTPDELMLVVQFAPDAAEAAIAAAVATLAERPVVHRIGMAPLADRGDA